MSRNRWTREQRNAMVADYQAGASLRDVAKKYGTTHSTVQRFVDEAGVMRDLNGIDPPKQRGYRPGSIMALGPQLKEEYEADWTVTVDTLARKYNCNGATIYRSLVAAGTQMRPAGGIRKPKHLRGLLSWLYS
jgi:transposase